MNQEQSDSHALVGTIEETAQVTPHQLLARAMNSGADMAVLERLMDLQDRYDAKQARNAYVADMAAFKQNPPEILKGKLVDFKTDKGRVTYRHAELGDVCNAVIKAMAGHGFSHNWNVQQGQLIAVTCTITHRLGHSESVTMQAAPDTSGLKNAIQSVSSAVTYLQRYTLLAATGLATNAIQDDDGRSASAEFIEESTVADLSLEAKDLGVDIPAFLQTLGAESFATILVKDLGRAKNLLAQKRRALDKKAAQA